MKVYYILVLTICLFSIGCYDDIDNTPDPEVIIEQTEVYIDTKIAGTVESINGENLKEYTLKINNDNYSIDGDYFKVHIENANKKGQIVQVLKNNKNIGIATFLLVENDINKVLIKEHQAIKSQIISDVFNIIELDNQISIDLKNAKWEGNYIGDIGLEYVKIEQSTSLTPVAYNQYLDVLAVNSIGGFFLKATTASGEPLDIKKDGKVKITLHDIPPNTNGLFELDKNDNWKLVSDIVNGAEVEVLASGYYAFGIYDKGVFVEGIVSKDDNVIAYQTMNWEEGDISNRFRSTETGKWIAVFPENNTTEISLLNPCNESIFTETITIKNSDIYGEVLIVNSNNPNFQTIDIEVKDCKGNNVENPNIAINSSLSNDIYSFSSSSTVLLSVCEDVTISAIDENGNNGPEMILDDQLSQNIDYLTNCAEYIDGFSHIVIREDTKYYTAFNVSEEDNQLVIRSENQKFRLRINGTESRKYSENEVNIFIDEEEFGTRGYYISCENSEIGCGISNCEVARYGNNKWLKISFEGELWMQSYNPWVAGNYPISAEITVKIN
ncbi:MAG: hypothetical protein V3V14_12685 [Saprospiraceae bacterium]